MKKLYLKFENLKGYDSYYIPVNKKDETWKSILDSIESVLDDKFIENNDQLDGIVLKMEIVYENPDLIEVDE